MVKILDDDDWDVDAWRGAWERAWAAAQEKADEAAQEELEALNSSDPKAWWESEELERGDLAWDAYDGDFNVDAWDIDADAPGGIIDMADWEAEVEEIRDENDDPSVHDEEVWSWARESREFDGWTPLHWVAIKDCLPEVVWLDVMEEGVCESDEEDCTLLHHAAAMIATPDIIARLVDLGAELEASDVGGWTPLHWAARDNDNPDVITRLVAAGADLEARNECGDTPLHIATNWNTNPDMIVRLIELGADNTAITDNGKTVWDLALEYEARRERGRADMPAVEGTHHVDLLF